MRHSSGVEGRVTDGPFLWRTADGTLLCLWASFSQAGYTQALAVSDNGEIDGRFTQAEPLFWRDGGHGMVFRGLDGGLYLTLHSPNAHLEERPHFFPLEEVGGRLRVVRSQAAGDAALPAWAPELRRTLAATARQLEDNARPWAIDGPTVTPEDMGYRGEGLATEYIQGAIDRAHALGGGTALLAKGDYVTGTLVMKSRVRLMIDAGARLLGSVDLNDYPEHHAARLTVQDTSMGMHQSLIFAEGCEDIALCGGGEIDGRGTPDNFPGEETAQGTPGRPFGLRIIDCKRVYVAGLTLRNAACWMQNYLNCEDVLLEDLTVRNHANYNNDGIDIDGCRRVVVRRCDVRSGDDALCFKGAGLAELRNVLVEDCQLYSACNALKVGTDTQGDFRRVIVRRCALGGLAEDPSGLKHPCCDSGISLEMVDGGALEDFWISEIQMTRAWSPFFMRLEDRGRVRPGDPRPGPGTLDRVLIEHVRGEDNGPRGSYFIGIPERRLGRVALRDVCLRQKPSRKPALDEGGVDELRGAYPDAHMIDALGDAPAYGLWARHMDALSLVDWQVIPDDTDPRPELVVSTDVGELRRTDTGIL